MVQKKVSDLAHDGAMFKDTLNLPRTDFPIRANAHENDPKMLARWKSEQLYKHATESNQGAQKYILHDGPPYANGSIHLGHAYNKILKDIMAKAHRMMGFHVPVKPGWDCHGLPIELKVTQDFPHLKKSDLKKACRDYALRWVNVQREEFIALGVIMDWDNPYLTMSPEYESSIVRAFGKLVGDGYIERKNKTIPWCWHCCTTLASAEIEYQERKDPSLYVLFELEDSALKAVLPYRQESLYFLVWTTTPWTIPLNRAVVLRPGSSYQIIRLLGRLVIVAEALVDKVVACVSGEKEIIATVNAEQFYGVRVHHPLVDGVTVPVLFDQSVGLDEGTACVHNAPGCGPIDYEIGVKNGLEIYSPLTDHGSYSDDIRPEELKGMSIVDGQVWVIKTLSQRNKLFFKTTIRHSFPHCWRCRNGLMFRATPQWFCNLDHNNARAKALKALDSMKFFPEQGKNFLRATIENRWEWCLSRQREWGVPLPALIHNDGVQIFTSQQFINFVADGVKKEGIEYWDRVTIEELIGSGVVPSHITPDTYRKEDNIIDVWFESGVSHAAVLHDNTLLAFPADLYIEGIDQYRAWFQSSLLTSIMLYDEVPTRALMSHGFTVDEKGHKMSKSLGNVVAPQQIIDQLGTDGLRLWVASIGNDGDAIVSDALLNNVGNVLRKIRNTCRFLLQNLYDFDYSLHRVDFDDCSLFDRYALQQLVLLQNKIIQDYKKGNLTAIFHALGEYCAVELSSFYGDIAKDILYCDHKESLVRRSTQTAFWYILDALTRLIAPIMSFTAEQVADFYQQDKPVSIHMQHFADLSVLSNVWSKEHIAKNEMQWKKLKEVRTALLKMIEIQREQGIIKHSLEACLTLAWDDQEAFDFFGSDDIAKIVKMLLIVSQVTVQSSPDGLEQTSYKGLFARVEQARGVKCPRCWHWDLQAREDGLCLRCQNIVPL